LAGVVYGSVGCHRVRCEGAGGSQSPPRAGRGAERLEVTDLTLGGWAGRRPYTPFG